MELNIKETEKAIKYIKDNFEKNLAEKLNLTRVSAPLFVLASQGLNDGLSGIEEPISFKANGFNDYIQIVHSLAKWKRMALKEYNFDLHEGIYTDMNAIRKDEILDATHSMYVDQWDWEAIILKEERTIKTLKTFVNKITWALHKTSVGLNKLYPALDTITPKKVTFVTSKQLLRLYPDVTSKERERLHAKKHGLIFVIGIGGEIKKGVIHEKRAPDYDDWSMNGDLLIYFKPLDIALELSSMGVRVDKDSLLSQLTVCNKLNDLSLPYHNALMNDILPFTIGGGIGQSRLCQLLLNKRHIGEVQASLWPKEEIEKEKAKGIIFL